MSPRYQVAPEEEAKHLIQCMLARSDIEFEIAQKIKHAIAEEREACAKLVEGSTDCDTSDNAAQVAIKLGVTQVLAAAIRARSSEPKATVP